MASAPSTISCAPGAVGDTPDAGEQLRLPCAAATAVVTHAGKDDAERQTALRLGDVRLIDHAHLAAAIALDAQEPRREGTERLVQHLPLALVTIAGTSSVTAFRFVGGRALWR